MLTNIIIVIVLLLVVGGAVKGWKHGMVRELSALIGLIGALTAIVLFLLALQNYWKKDHKEMLITVLGFIIVVLAYKVIDFVLASLKLISNLPVVSGLDKLLGIAVGAGEGILLIWILFLLITAFDIAGLRGPLLVGIQGNEWLQYLFNHNYLAKLVDLF